MSLSPITTANAKPGSEIRRHRSNPLASGLWKCLLVSRDRLLLTNLERAAFHAGWDVICLSDPRECMREAILRQIGLAVVDLSGPHSDRAYYEDLFRLVRQSGIDGGNGEGGLTAACAPDGDAESELWARQQGVWMYLPEVNEQSDFALVCQEARESIERLLQRERKNALS